MPYSDPDKQRVANRRAQAKHYQNNKQYYIDKAKERRLRIQQALRELKLTLKCAKCSEDHPACLDFHHDDPNEKEFSLARAASMGYSIERIKEEMAKCTVLCSNCHRKEHYAGDSAGEQKPVSYAGEAGSIPVPATNQHRGVV